MLILFWNRYLIVFRKLNFSNILVMFFQLDFGYGRYLSILSFAPLELGGDCWRILLIEEYADGN